jgi:hypothetical protein
MSEMLSTLSRCLRGCALAMAVALLVGCTRAILGTVQPTAPVPNSVPIRVVDLLIELGQFPARYHRADATAVYRALQDVDGCRRLGGDPLPQCAPPRTPWDSPFRARQPDATSLIVT